MEAKRVNKRSFGSIGEDIAASYLERNNYTILTRNYRVGRLGELDIIAKEGEYICFIEVKTRTSIFFGMPSEAVNYKKQVNIRRLASIYISQHKLHSANIRFDVIEILGNRKNTGQFEVGSINLIQNAF